MAEQLRRKLMDSGTTHEESARAAALREAKLQMGSSALLAES